MLIELSHLIYLVIYQDVLINSLVTLADAVNEAVSVEKLLRRGGHPHKGIGIFAENIKLTGSLKQEYATVNVVGQFLLDHL